MHKKIRRKTPNTYQTATSAPSINSVLGYLRDEFNIDDINGNGDIDFATVFKIAPESLFLMM
jgi:hypothetical protein